MCSRPQEKDGNTFACRTCDDCIATRRSNWISRAMAEKTDHKHALCVALSYDDETEENRDAARMFAYADVRAFMARLRSYLRRRKLPSSIRFLCAGEQGDRFGRCHWHLILYSDADLTKVGIFKLRGRVVTSDNEKDFYTEGKRKRRLHWDQWGKGFVTMQKPDQGGMHYVLSYCLKDQFTEQKSRDTMREAKSENFATGLFRMSKRPAIGERFVVRKMVALDASGSVLPSLKITIPETSGFWVPNGTLRKLPLVMLTGINQRVRWATGADAPQWSSLQASLKDMQSDLELMNGEETQNPDDYESDEAIFARRSRETAERQRRGEMAFRCGGAYPCTECLHDLPETTITSLGLERLWPEDGGEWQYRPLAGEKTLRDLQRERGKGINPYCGQRGTKAARLTFPATGG